MGMTCKCGKKMDLIEPQTLTYQCPVCGRCDTDADPPARTVPNCDQDPLTKIEAVKEGESEWLRALVVVDMQKDFINGKLKVQYLHGELVANNVCDILRRIGPRYDRIVATVDSHRAQDFRDEDNMECRILPEHCLEFSEGMAIDEDVYKALQDLIHREKFVRFVKKSTFTTHTLAEHTLRSFLERENSIIDIVGLCTDVCVISTALMLRSEFPKAKIRIISDACAGTTEKRHQCALEVMDSCLIGNMTTKELIEEEDVWEEIRKSEG